MSSTRDEANRLAKYRSVYAGALAELGKGQPLGLLPRDYPGLPLVRDLVEKILLARAELNGLCKLLVDKGVFTQAELEATLRDEYAWLADAHEASTGWKATQDGLTMTPESAKRAVQREIERRRES